MPNKTLSNPSLTAFITAGALGLTLINPAIAQHPATKTPPLQMAQSSSLAGNWRLANMTAGDSPMPMLPSKELTADFANGRVSGSGGCNRFNGSYKTTGKQQLTIGPLATTYMACEEGVMTQESNYLKALQAAQRYELNKDGLQIFYKTDQGSGVLRFVSQDVRGLW
jgi:heat shock protein HslJ